MSLAVAGDESAPAAPPPRPVPVADLVRRLGSEDFREREAAETRLANLNLDAPPPELLAALKSPKPEIRDRATRALATFRVRAEERALGRERAFAKRGAIDRFVSAALAWDVPADDERLWQAVLDVATGLSRRTKHGWTPDFGLPSVPPRIYWGSYRGLIFVRSGGPYRVPVVNAAGNPLLYQAGGIRAPEVTAPRTINANLIVAGGPVRAENFIDVSVVLANGDVSTKRYLGASVVVSDGDVDVTESVNGSLVIARGNITVGGYASRSTLIAGGKVVVSKKADLSNPEVVIEENARRPLGLVTFFELSQVGVEAAAAGGGVRLTRLAPGSPLARSEVAEGDLVTAVDRAAVRSPEDLRRQLRDASATRGEAVLTIRRGRHAYELWVALPD